MRGRLSECFDRNTLICSRISIRSSGSSVGSFVTTKLLVSAVENAPAHHVELALAKPDADNVGRQATVLDADGNQTRELSLILTLEVNSGTRLPEGLAWHSVCSVKTKGHFPWSGCFRLRQTMQEVSRSGITGELQLSALIADLWWRIDLMNSDILEEEAKAGVFDVQKPIYPLLALNLRARRDNLLSTIYALERRAKLGQVAA